MWKGICNGAKFVGKLFGYKAEDLYAKVVWKIIAGCTAAILLVFVGLHGYVFVREVVLKDWLKVGIYNGTPVLETAISNVVAVQKFEGEGNTRLYNKITGKTIMEGLDWVVVADDFDTLAVFSRNHRRGYINRHSGEVAIPAIYTKAWVFSEGLAAVEKDHELMFINRNGDIVIDKDFEVYIHGHDYGFKNGYCLMRSNKDKLFGYIDKNGNWVVEPQFDNVHDYGRYVWVRKNGLEGLLSPDLKEVLPSIYDDIKISYNNIFVQDTNLTAKLYDLEFNLVRDFVINEIEDLYYNTNKTVIMTFNDDDGETLHGEVLAAAKCKRYGIGRGFREKYGLMDASGKRLTQPIYDDIEAIGPGRYFCKPHGVILNDRGEIVE